MSEENQNPEGDNSGNSNAGSNYLAEFKSRFFDAQLKDGEHKFDQETVAAFQKLKKYFRIDEKKSKVETAVVPTIYTCGFFDVPVRDLLTAVFDNEDIVKTLEETDLKEALDRTIPNLKDGSETDIFGERDGHSEMLLEDATFDLGEFSNFACRPVVVDMKTWGDLAFLSTEHEAVAGYINTTEQANANGGFEINYKAADKGEESFKFANREYEIAITPTDPAQGIVSIKKIVEFKQGKGDGEKTNNMKEIVSEIGDLTDLAKRADNLGDNSLSATNAYDEVFILLKQSVPDMFYGPQK
jgi:hypothetical protein